MRPGVNQEQQKAVDFFNRYNKQQEQAEQLHEDFKLKTKKLFSEDFKGFDFQVGEKRYKYNVQNRDKVAENQSNIVVNKSKNLSNVKAREGNTGEVFVGGLKVKSISGADSTRLKIKTRKFNN